MVHLRAFFPHFTLWELLLRIYQQKKIKERGSNWRKNEKWEIAQTPKLLVWVARATFSPSFCAFVFFSSLPSPYRWCLDVLLLFACFRGCCCSRYRVNLYGNSNSGKTIREKYSTRLFLFTVFSPALLLCCRSALCCVRSSR